MGDIMGKIHIWNDETRAMVKDHWHIASPEAIRGMVTRYCITRAEAEGWGATMLPSIGGVLYQALQMELISPEQYEELKVEYKRKPISNTIKTAVIERDGGRCLVCGHLQRLEVDHIKPVMFGGHGGMSNLQTLCKACHKIKGINDIDCHRLDWTIRTGRVKNEFEVIVIGHYAGNKAALDLAARGAYINLSRKGITCDMRQDVEGYWITNISVSNANAQAQKYIHDMWQRSQNNPDNNP